MDRLASPAGLVHAIPGLTVEEPMSDSGVISATENLLAGRKRGQWVAVFYCENIFFVPLANGLAYLLKHILYFLNRSQEPIQRSRAHKWETSALCLFSV
jgi:hypothetical protein